MLVQVALFLFAMCATLSLIIDIGYAHITQAQMQNAADAAAIEGIRQRDRLADPARRESVNTVVGWTFDDNFDPTDGDADYQFGAGPIIDLTEGATSLHGMQTSSVPDVHVYKPNLQSNLGNAPEGDMVSGRFCYSADPLPSENVAYELQDTVCGQPQRGAGAYARNDFNPGGANPNAFLVRLRRSNEYQDLEGRMDPDVGSSGPSLPLTFGKGTTIHGDDPDSGYSVRRDGLTVRAVAIATIRPAMRVGLPQTNPVQPGVTNFALADTCVQAATGAAVTLTVTINPATGVITRTGAGTATCATGAVVGRFVTNRSAISTVGNTLPLIPAPIACTAATSLTGQYGPVFSMMATGAPRIIGFARVTFTRVAVCPPAPGTAFTATITRGVSQVAASNAGASLTGALSLPIGATPAALRELFDKNLVQNGRVNYAPVLVAVLAR